MRFGGRSVGGALTRDHANSIDRSGLDQVWQRSV